jgi:DNA-binding XRE family transcriptional regulator
VIQTTFPKRYPQISKIFGNALSLILPLLPKKSEPYQNNFKLNNMKTNEQEQARQLYIQTNLSKTEIGEKLGVNRKTIYQWSVEGDWEVLRASARCMPSILAQKVYHLIGHFTDHLLQRDVAYQSITKDEVNTLNKLVNMVSKLKAGSTASENMETFTLLLEGLKVKDPFLAEEMAPHFNDFVTSKATMAHNTFLMAGFEKNATKPFPEKDITEKWQDEKDYDAIVEENKQAAEQEVKQPEAAHKPAPTTPTVDKNAPIHTKFRNSYKSWVKTAKPANPAKPTIAPPAPVEKVINDLLDAQKAA